MTSFKIDGVILILDFRLKLENNFVPRNIHLFKSHFALFFRNYFPQHCISVTEYNSTNTVKLPINITFSSLSNSRSLSPLL